MKTRIALTLGVLVGAPFLDKALFHPAETIVKNNVAVSTLNGGDGAFVAQQAVHSASSLGHILFGAVVLAVLVAIWFAPIKKWWQTDPIINSAA
jgi:hypothetical protein